MNILPNLKNWIKEIDRTGREKATRHIEYELSELEYIFGLLCFPGASGIPDPPVYSLMELLPLLSYELDLIGSESRNENDTLSNLVGLFGID